MLISMVHIFSNKCIQFFSTRFLIRIGDLDHNSTADDRFAKDLSILKITIHPNFNREAAYYDIAIFEIEPISFSDAIRPVCLPSAPSEDIKRYDNDFVELTGWGRKNIFGKISQKLKRVSVKIFSQR